MIGDLATTKLRPMSPSSASPLAPPPLPPTPVKGGVGQIKGVGRCISAVTAKVKGFASAQCGGESCGD